MTTESTLGSKIRALRRQQHLTQTELARRLGISPSYLNLLEHNRRPVPGDLLVRLADILPVELRALSAAQDSRIVSDLTEAFGDPLFGESPLSVSEVRELGVAYPNAARGMLQLYGAYRALRETVQDLTDDPGWPGADPAAPHRSTFPSDEVSDLIQRHLNYFPALEAGADALSDQMGDRGDALFDRLSTYLRETRGVEVRIGLASAMRSALRRYDADRGVVFLSEVLRRGSRNFQLAHQVCLLTQATALNTIADDPLLTSDESRALCRVALANYFASAVLMPYNPFLQAARSERYDVELLGHRFRASFEQTCQRLTTLRRPGAEGVPFHMLRIDVAGNVSKRFSASGFRFARFSGGCPRWNVFNAFQSPGTIRAQVSQFPDGSAFFEIARTVHKQSGGYQGSHTRFAIALGCDVVHARELVYADALNLERAESRVPVGLTCRLCDRGDCDQRAHPNVQHKLRVNENVRGVAFYAPLKE